MLYAVPPSLAKNPHPHKQGEGARSVPTTLGFTGTARFIGQRELYCR